MDEYTNMKKDKPPKKKWIKPELEVLTISNTEYWEYRWNDDTQFFQEVWVS